MYNTTGRTLTLIWEPNLALSVGFYGIRRSSFIRLFEEMYLINVRTCNKTVLEDGISLKKSEDTI